MPGAADTRIPAVPETPSLSSETAEDADSQTVLRTAAMTAALTGGGVAGRVALQGVPSVEPLLPLAIAVGAFVSWRQGAIIGISGFYASNFLVWGGQGPWTVFQCLGTGLAAVTGAAVARGDAGKWRFVTALAAGTVLYEGVVNLGSLVATPWLLAGGAAGLLAALPYAAVHLTSSLGFGGILYGIRRSIEHGYGQR